jgi:hypothetical protein
MRKVGRTCVESVEVIEVPLHAVSPTKQPQSAAHLPKTIHKMHMLLSHPGPAMTSAADPYLNQGKCVAVSRGLIIALTKVRVAPPRPEGRVDDVTGTSSHVRPAVEADESAFPVFPAGSLPTE